MFATRALFVLGLIGGLSGATAQDVVPLRPADIFELEWAEDPRISPDGSRIVYARRWMDIQTDNRRSTLWLLASDGDKHRPITGLDVDAWSARWSPSGDRLAFVASRDGKPQLYVRWMDSGETTRLAQLESGPRSISWSPNGTRIAFVMDVEAEGQTEVEMPERPEGAEWADPPRYIDELIYRRDGSGFVEESYAHVFVVPADGGTPRQLTTGEFNHQGPINWTPDGEALIFSGNRHEDWRYEPLNTEIYRLNLEDRSIFALTDRMGPDENPVLSGDGRRIAYTGFDDRRQGYQISHLYVMDADGGRSRVVTTGLDRSVESPRWRSNGRAIYFLYDNEGVTRLASVSLDGGVTTIAENLGGASIGRPYPGASFSVSDNDTLAFNFTSPSHPADVAVIGRRSDEPRRLTRLNDDLLRYRDLASIESIWLASSHDERRIQAWIAKPPGFDSEERYPLVLEIHGGPFANYGPRFSSEVQLYAAAGYVVLYVNPRGSTSYGEEFGNLIHHAYPGNDYDDLMSAVDAVVEKGFVDPERLFVTGGSGGGVLSAWIVGHTDRFRAAVVAKPVINWYSFVLTADFYNFFYKYWFPGLPWDHAEHYLQRSPIHHAGNVTTPTMVLTGEADYRTPMSESEQFYQALKLERVDAALVRIPGASHHIAERPSQLIAKVQYVLHWFNGHGGDKGKESD